VGREAVARLVETKIEQLIDNENLWHLEVRIGESEGKVWIGFEQILGRATRPGFENWPVQWWFEAEGEDRFKTIQARDYFHKVTEPGRRGAWLIPPLSDSELMVESRFPDPNAALAFKLFLLDGELPKEQAMRMAIENVLSHYPNASLQVIRAGVQTVALEEIRAVWDYHIWHFPVLVGEYNGQWSYAAHGIMEEGRLREELASHFRPTNPRA
jgi:hypothetical protein